MYFYLHKQRRDFAGKVVSHNEPLMIKSRTECKKKNQTVYVKIVHVLCKLCKLKRGDHRPKNKKYRKKNNTLFNIL